MTMTRRSHTEVEGTMLAFGVGLDIDACEHQRRRVAHQPRAEFPHALPDVEGDQSWDFPHDGDRKLPKAHRRAFWEGAHWTDQWAQLMDRPRKGIGKSCVWQEEVLPTPAIDEVPADVREGIMAIEREINHSLASRGLRPISTESLAASAKSALRPISSQEITIPKLWNTLYEAVDTAWCDEVSFLHPADEKPVPGSSRTDSTLTPSPSQVTPAASPRVGSDRTGSDSISTDSSRQLSDRDYGIHRPADLPLSLRRVMASVLPADPDSSLSLSSSQMRKLAGYNNAVRAQKRPPSQHKAAPKWRAH